MLLHGFTKLHNLTQEFRPYLLARRQISELLFIDFFMDEKIKNKMFVNFGIFMQRRLREGALSFEKYFLPPAHLSESDVIDGGGSTEGFIDSLLGFAVFALYHRIDIVELIVDLLQNLFKLVLQYLLVLLHLHVDVFDAIQFLLQHLQIVLIVASDVGDGVLAGDDAVVLVDGRPVDAVYAEKFELVLAVERDEVVVDEALLGQFVFVGYLVEIETGAEVVFAGLQGLDVLRVVFLQQDRSLGGRALFPHGSVGVRGVGEGLAFLSV